jgi:hypothetical protein
MREYNRSRQTVLQAVCGASHSLPQASHRPAAGAGLGTGSVKRPRGIEIRTWTERRGVDLGDGILVVIPLTSVCMDEFVVQSAEENIRTCYTISNHRRSMTRRGRTRGTDQISPKVTFPLPVQVCDLYWGTEAILCTV